MRMNLFGRFMSNLLYRSMERGLFSQGQNIDPRAGQQDAEEQANGDAWTDASAAPSRVDSNSYVLAVQRQLVETALEDLDLGIGRESLMEVSPKELHDLRKSLEERSLPEEASGPLDIVSGYLSNGIAA